MARAEHKGHNGLWNVTGNDGVERTFTTRDEAREFRRAEKKAATGKPTEAPKAQATES